MGRGESWDREYRTNMGGEQNTFTFALRGHGKRGIVHNRRRVVGFAIGSMDTVDGNCWRCGGCGSRGSQKAGDYGHGRHGDGHATRRRVDVVLVITMAVTGESASRLDGYIRFGRRRSAAWQNCPIAAALRYSVVKGVPGED